MPLTNFAKAPDRPIDVDLIRRVPESDYREALESWTWVELEGKVPLFTSLFGDVFFQARDGYWFLDTPSRAR